MERPSLSTTASNGGGNRKRPRIHCCKLPPANTSLDIAGVGAELEEVWQLKPKHHIFETPDLQCINRRETNNTLKRELLDFTCKSWGKTKHEYIVDTLVGLGVQVSTRVSYALSLTNPPR